MKISISSILISVLSISFVLLSSQQCTQSEKELDESNIYPSNAIDFSQSMLVYIKSELPYQSYSDTLREINLKKLKSELNSPSKSIVQLYEIEFDLLKTRCIRAENALGQSYRSLDKLNDLIVATDSSSQLASNNSVNALLSFFQQVSF